MSCLKRLERVGYFATQHAGGAWLWLHLLSPVLGECFEGRAWLDTGFLSWARQPRDAPRVA